MESLARPAWPAWGTERTMPFSRSWVPVFRACVRAWMRSGWGVLQVVLQQGGTASENRLAGGVVRGFSSCAGQGWYGEGGREVVKAAGSRATGVVQVAKRHRDRRLDCALELPRRGTRRSTLSCLSRGNWREAQHALRRANRGARGMHPGVRRAGSTAGQGLTRRVPGPGPKEGIGG